MKKNTSVTNDLVLFAEYGFLLIHYKQKKTITFKTNETKWKESTSRSSFFHLSRRECVIKRFVENASKQKTVDTAKLKKINNNH